MVLTIQIEKKVVMNKILNKIVWPIILAPGIYLAFIWNNIPEKCHAFRFKRKCRPVWG